MKKNYSIVLLLVLGLMFIFSFPDSAHAVKLRQLARYSFLDQARAVSIGSNTLFAACRGNGVRYLRNATSFGESFYPVGSFATVDARDVYYDRANGILYVADGAAGIRVLKDNGTSASLTQLAITNTPGTAMAIAKRGHYLYVADDLEGMQVVDISNPSHPVIRGHCGTGQRATYIEMNGYTAYVADGAGGLVMMDTTNPDNPTFQGSGFATGYAQGLSIFVMGSKPYLIMANGVGLRILDITGFPTSTALMDSFIAFKVDTFQNFAYATSGLDGLTTIQLSNPNTPVEVGTRKMEGNTLGVTEYERKLWVSVQTGGVEVLQIAWLPNDYNGDGVSDLAAYELATGNWFIRSLGPVGPANPPITFGENWGGAGLIPVPGDFNGDSVADLAAYEPASGGWFVKSMGGPAPMVFADIMGGPNAVPYWGDYMLWDSQGDTRCVYDTVDTEFTYRTTSTITTHSYNWGIPGARPVPGDYNGDGVSDWALYDPTTGNWYIKDMITRSWLMNGENWGGPGLVPVPGDYDGDTRFDLALYELATGNWYIKSLWKAEPICFGQNWGGAGLYPVPGDFNGDGVWDLSTYQTSTGNWFIRSLGPVGPGYPPICFGQNWGGPGLVPPGMVQ